MNVWTVTDRTSTLYRRVIKGFTIPDWYFSRIGRIQRLPPLWKLNPAMQILNYCKFVGLFDSKKISINICHEFWLAGWNRTTIGHTRNYSYMSHNLYWSTIYNLYCIIGQAQSKLIFLEWTNAKDYISREGLKRHKRLYSEHIQNLALCHCF